MLTQLNEAKRGDAQNDYGQIHARKQVFRSEDAMTSYFVCVLSTDSDSWPCRACDYNETMQ